MAINIHILKAGNRLTPYLDIIQDSINQAVLNVQNKIKIKGVDIVIADNPQGAIPETGVGGYAPTPHLVYLNINPNFSDIEQKLSLEIKSTIAHELHHCSRDSIVGYGKTLLEAMVSEGLADHFDIEINNTNPKPWDVAVDENTIITLFEIAKKEYFSTTYNHNQWFFGSKERSIPRWAGYSLGFCLVGDYMKRTGKTASELVDVDAQEFIK